MKNINLPEGPFKPEWESLKNYKIPEWYKDAKFGIFIHFGVYSVPAFGNEWYSRNMYVQGTPEYEHHLKTYGTQKVLGYKDFIPLFKAEKFDPYSWADLFRKAGAKYVVPVAEHHDGFAMYDCSFTRWCATKIGPKRDIIGELAKAVRENFLTFGVSYHRAEHWWFFNEGMKFDSDVRDKEYFDLYGPAQPETMQPTEDFLNDWYLRLTEIVDKYQPQLIYFDWWIEQPAFEPYLKKFFAYYYNRACNWERGVVINYKLNAVPRECAVFDMERGKLSDIDPVYWQTDTSISRLSWGYIEKDVYKPAKELIWELIDVVSRNGNLLLNVGPKADGTIPEEAEKTLLEIGNWLLINGEAIYGTRPWRIYGEGPTRGEAGSFSEKPTTYTSKDFRFTTKKDVLYVILMEKPEGDEIVIKSLGKNFHVFNREIVRIELLEKKAEAKFSREDDGVRIKIPEFDKIKYPAVFKIFS
ncbi:MAG TPA: alpha-L-fucosidase [Dictyoglomaceae bacterium]|nr:alpha-L-fucosidase [Dictyoglomaceae bacterium]